MITDIEQQTLDIEWFFTDGENIGFVTSCGGKLPKVVAESFDTNSMQQLADYFWELPLNTSHETNTLLKEKITDDFIYMSQRGLFTFDKTKPGNFSDENYHLITKPVIPLKIVDLPANIATIVLKSQFKISENFKIKYF